MKSLFKMNKLHTGVVAAIVGGTILAAGVAEATPALIPGETIQMKYRNWEQFRNNLSDGSGNFSLPAAGTGLANGTEDLRGIMQMTSIFQPITAGSPLWSPTTTDQIWGVFYGFDLDRVSGTNFQYVGGQIDIFTLSSAIDPYAPGALGGVAGFGPNSWDYKGITDGTKGSLTPWLTLSFEPGIVPSVPTTTLNADTNVGTAPFTGAGSAYLSMTTNHGLTGTANSSLDTNTILDSLSVLHDVFMSNTFRTAKDINGDIKDDLTLIKCEGIGCQKFVGTADAGNGWNLVSEDPVIGAVPEPASIALLGLGLAGLGFSRRNKKAA